jgi:endonuclease/exonuclease/phosphatase (EEP) superfamily protein YafD
MVKRQSVKRDYRAVIESLKQVWRIERVPDEDSVWRLGEAEHAAFSGDLIRVAVWNMCKGVGGVLFEHDYRSLCYRADLILTQEALLSRRSMQTFCERGFHSVHAASYKRRDGLRDGVMTSSRTAPCEGTSRRVICKYPEPLLKTPKAALLQCYPLIGTHKTLLVINIHATLIRFKAAAVEEMEHLLTHLPIHDGPIILAGDFNTFTAGYLQAVSHVLRKQGLHYVPIPNDPRPKTQALDQVFVRDLDVTAIRVDTGVRNSDHFPIFVDLKTSSS